MNNSNKKKKKKKKKKGGGLFVGWLLNVTSQQHASVSQGRICSDSCRTEIEAADQTFYLTQSHYTDTASTSSSADPYNARRLAG